MTGPPAKDLRREAKSWAKSIGIALLIWLFLRSYVLEAYRIPSPSMEPTLLVGDFLFVEKLVYGGEFDLPVVHWRFLPVPGYGAPRRDQIVVFRSVEDSTPNLSVVKRIVGAPGDTLQMVRDTVIRNGWPLDEPYALHLADGGSFEDQVRLRQIRTWQLRHYIGADPERYRPTTHDWGPIVVPAGHYFVMGDNRDESYDSRYWGFLPERRVLGRPMFIYMSVAGNPFRIRWNRIFRTPG